MGTFLCHKRLCLKIIALISLVLILVKYTQHRFYLCYHFQCTVALGHLLGWVATILSISRCPYIPKLKLCSYGPGATFCFPWTTLGVLQRWIHVLFVLCDWLISLGIMSSRFLYAVAYDQMPLFLGMENVE